MNHLEYAKKIITAPPKRHHNSKFYKKYTQDEKVVIDTENLDHEKMYNLAAEWFNSWNESIFIEEIVKGYNRCKNDDMITSFLLYTYKKYATIVPNWKNMITESFFIIKFKYIIPHFFIPWLQEEKYYKRKKLTGNLQRNILYMLWGKKTVSLARILHKNCDKDNYFNSTVTGEITKMINRGLIKEIETNNKLFYALSNKVGYDRVKDEFFIKE